MIIKKAEFIKSAAATDGFVKSDLPQIAVCGKSNVGKSTFINMLANNSKLARTSNLPGRTRLINYFDFKDFILTDLPGYGYAKASKSEKESWGSLIETYLLEEKKLIRVLMLVDIRHDPTEDDKLFSRFLYYNRIPFNIIATKSDKLKKQEIKPHLFNIAGHLNVGIDNIIASSGVNKEGKDETIRLISEIIK